MADVLKKNLVVPQKLAHIRPSSRKSQQGGGIKSQIYPLTVKETADAYHAHATLEPLL